MDSTACDILVSYLVANHKRSEVYDKTYAVHYESLRQKRFHAYVPYEIMVGHALTFWNGWFPLFVSQGSRGKDRDDKVSFIAVTFVRYTFDFEKVFAKAVLSHNERIWEHKVSLNPTERRFFVRHVPDFNTAMNTVSDGVPMVDWNPLLSRMAAVPWYLMTRNRILGYRVSDLGPAMPAYGSALMQLVFPPKVEELIEEVKLWRK